MQTRFLFSMAAVFAGAVTLAACQSPNAAAVAHVGAGRIVSLALPDDPNDVVQQMQFSSNGERVMVRGLHSLTVLNAEHGTELKRLPLQGPSRRWAQYLENGAIVLDGRPTPVLLQPNFELSTLPPGALGLSPDGRLAFVQRSTEAPSRSGRVQTLGGGETVCDLKEAVGPDAMVQFSRRFVAVSRISTRVAVCDLTNGSVVWLHAPHADFTDAWMDREGRWLLVAGHRRGKAVGGMEGDSALALYALPLEVNTVMHSGQEGKTYAEVTPVKTWRSPTWVKAVFSADGGWLAIRSETETQLISLNRLEATSTLPVRNTADSAYRAFFSRNSRWIALQDDSTILMADLNSNPPEWMRVQSPSGLTGFTLHDISPDGTKLIVSTRPTPNSEQRAIWRVERAAH